MISTFWKYALPACLLVSLTLLCLGLLVYPFKNIERPYEESSSLESPLLPPKQSTVPGPLIHHVVSSDEEHDSSTSERVDLPQSRDTVIYIALNSDDDDTNDVCNSYCGSPVHRQKEEIQSLSLAESAPTPAQHVPSPLSAFLTNEQRKVFLLLMALNFTTRGAIAVYETQGSQILLDRYGLSELQLGAIVSSAGEVLLPSAISPCI